MTSQKSAVFPNTYLDSVKILAGTRSLQETPGVDWATVVMGTPNNVSELLEEGFSELEKAGANDLIIAARAESPAILDEAIESARTAMFSHSGDNDTPETTSIRSLWEARALAEPANLALVSVGGDYATLEAHKALTAGMDVLLFSDNVALANEVELKTRARSKGLFVMGPGAGTAMVDGIGLGFSNSVRRGSVGIVAAAGTGAQEAMTLVHRAGLGVSQVIGVGGRDMSSDVGGIMTAMGIAALEADPATDVILVVSKPPSPDVAERILSGTGNKPVVAALVGLSSPSPAAATITSSLEGGVTAVCQILGVEPPWAGENPPQVDAGAPTSPIRRAIRGLFSGGTLCYEAMTIMAGQGMEVFSNTPLRPEWALDGAAATSHVCLDMGEEEFTQNRPHPMIDPQARIEAIKDQGNDPHTAVLLVDVVLGYGSHTDPAGLLAPTLEPFASSAEGPAVVAYVLGTDQDPQGLDDQRHQLAEAGCLIAPTNRRAALMAAAIANRTGEGTQ